jgi:hypothetical protein
VDELAANSLRDHLITGKHIANGLLSVRNAEGRVAISVAMKNILVDNIQPIESPTEKWKGQKVVLSLGSFKLQQFDSEF